MRTAEDEGAFREDEGRAVKTRTLEVRRAEIILLYYHTKEA